MNACRMLTGALDFLLGCFALSPHGLLELKGGSRRIGFL